MYPKKYRCADPKSCRANRTYCVRIRTYSYVLRTYFCTYLYVSYVFVRIVNTKGFRICNTYAIRTIRTIRTQIRTKIRTQIRTMRTQPYFSGHVRIRTYSYVFLYVFVRIVRICTYFAIYSPSSSASCAICCAEASLASAYMML